MHIRILFYALSIAALQGCGASTNERPDSKRPVSTLAQARGIALQHIKDLGGTGELSEGHRGRHAWVFSYDPGGHALDRLHGVIVFDDGTVEIHGGP